MDRSVKLPFSWSTVALVAHGRDPGPAVSCGDLGRGVSELVFEFRLTFARVEDLLEDVDGLDITRCTHAHSTAHHTDMLRVIELELWPRIDP